MPGLPRVEVTVAADYAVLGGNIMTRIRVSGLVPTSQFLHKTDRAVGSECLLEPFKGLPAS